MIDYISLTAIIMIAAIVVYLVASIIYDAFQTKRLTRYVAAAEYLMPKVRDEMTEMSVEMISRINDKIFEQAMKDGES